MKWTVLTDNRTKNPLLETEHGLSILLETSQHKILLDTGASNLFVRNAERLGIDLRSIDYVFISHGHSDHAGGLRYIMELNGNAKIIVSPYAIEEKFFSKHQYLHSITTVWPDIPKERLISVNQNREIANEMRVIAKIPHVHPLPQGNQHLFVQDTKGQHIPDDFRHELVLYADGLLFTGCAHSGLENILAACPWPIQSVLGGFHLLDGHETEEELASLAKRLKAAYPKTQFYTSHCTGDMVFVTLKGVLQEQIHAFSCGDMVHSGL